MKTHREKDDEVLLSTSLREFLLKIRGNLVGIINDNMPVYTCVIF